MDVTRGSKWEPVYEGPYSILHQHKSGTYSLLDAMGEFYQEKYQYLKSKSQKLGSTPQCLRGSNEEEHFMVKRIIEHRMSDGMYDYLVEWK